MRQNIHRVKSPQDFPRGALLGAAGLIAITILAAGYGRLTGAHVQMPPSSAVAERSLRFQDQADGAVLVRDAHNGRQVAILAAGSNAFLRATMRGLAQQRMREGISPQTPFRLTALSDGRLTLRDPTTGRHIDLEAFGETNASAFAALLTDQEAAR